ncbi:uncharacterized protein LOC133196104 [Saccostrea echinata]|uniref:uncharacterized protein LOC133196104 n=1 Tax=Saccostrea echinata TaxID=191078 RepID=UPI002A840A18|nr:uncharacterized protein LOC133196104 [Saccostrea echinata]
MEQDCTENSHSRRVLDTDIQIYEELEMKVEEYDPSFEHDSGEHFIEEQGSLIEPVETAKQCNGNSRSSYPRGQLTMGQKREMCIFKEENPKYTMRKIRDHFQEKWNRHIGHSTVSDILKLKSKYLSLPKLRENCRRIRKTRNFDMEEKLYKWIVENNMRGVGITNNAIKEKAQSLGEEFAVDETFSYSNGWLHCFKIRYGLNKRKIATETSPVVVGSQIDFMNQIHSELKFYDLNEVYCVEELKLIYNLKPYRQTSTMASVVVGLCSNANGSNMLKPFVFTPPSNAKILGERFQPDNYAWFRIINSKDANLFSDWILDFDEQLSINKKKALLLLKFSLQHEEIESGLRNIKLMYLPQSVEEVSMNNPFDAGLLDEFKTRYRGYCLQHYIEQQSKGEQENLGLRDALRYIYNSWVTVPPQTILKYWQQSKLLSCVEVLNIPSNAGENIGNDAQVLMRKIEGDHKMTIEQYLRFEEINNITLQSETDTDNKGQGTEVTDECPRVSCTEAREGLLKCIRFTEQTENATQKLQTMWNMMKWLDKQQ